MRVLGSVGLCGRPSLPPLRYGPRRGLLYECVCAVLLRALSHLSMGGPPKEKALGDLHGGHAQGLFQFAVASKWLRFCGSGGGGIAVRIFLQSSRIFSHDGISPQFPHFLAFSRIISAPGFVRVVYPGRGVGPNGINPGGLTGPTQGGLGSSGGGRAVLLKHTTLSGPPFRKSLMVSGGQMCSSYRSNPKTPRPLLDWRINDPKVFLVRRYLVIVWDNKSSVF